jgi:hypothetical protein
MIEEKSDGVSTMKKEGRKMINNKGNGRGLEKIDSIGDYKYGGD